MSESPRGGTAGPLDYEGPRAKRPRSHPLVVLLAVALCAMGLLALASDLLVLQSGSHPTANRVKCASNLRQIGQAILLFSNDNGGRYPDTLGTILMDEDISPAVMNCPSTNDVPPTKGPTTRAMDAAIAVPGHCSYIYLGKGLTQQTVRADMVIAYEPLANHGGTGMNVLFGDGHVEFFATGNDTTAILNQVAAGTWPVRVAGMPGGAAVVFPTPVLPAATQTAPAR